MCRAADGLLAGQRIVHGLDHRLQRVGHLRPVRVALVPSDAIQQPLRAFYQGVGVVGMLVCHAGYLISHVCQVAPRCVARHDLRVPPSPGCVERTRCQRVDVLLTAASLK